VAEICENIKSFEFCNTRQKSLPAAGLPADWIWHNFSCKFGVDKFRRNKKQPEEDKLCYPLSLFHLIIAVYQNLNL
jgi:hypothetical protein